MNKILKITLLSLLGVVLLLTVAAGAFIYKARYGFNFYESTPPELPAELAKPAILLFSKTNGYRHGDAIAASLPVFEQMAERNDWSLFVTDNGAVFNEEQLAQFQVVIWNNTSGKVLDSMQRQTFRAYLEKGGGFVGLHAAGDNSHQWDWYENEVIGAHFSHHPLDPQLQEATLSLESTASGALQQGLPSLWEHTEEWYMFSDNPRERGSNVLYTLDESDVNPSGNLGFLVTDKDWGMGDDHPVAWYHPVGQGRAFYSSLGHDAEAFQDLTHLRMLENAVRWAAGE